MSAALPVAPFEWSADGSFPAPLEYVVPASGEVQPYTATATYDGSGAGGAFIPTISLYSAAGNLLARVNPSAVLQPGDVAEVTFVPPFGAAASDQPGTGGIRFNTAPQAGDWLYVETTGHGGPNGAGQDYEVAGGAYQVQSTDASPLGWFSNGGGRMDWQILQGGNMFWLTTGGTGGQEFHNDCDNGMSRNDGSAGGISDNESGSGGIGRFDTGHGGIIDSTNGPHSITATGNFDWVTGGTFRLEAASNAPSVIQHLGSLFIENQAAANAGQTEFVLSNAGNSVLVRDNGSNTWFIVRQDGAIFMPHLRTSAPSAGTHELWNNAGVVSIA